MLRKIQKHFAVRVTRHKLRDAKFAHLTSHNAKQPRSKGNAGLEIPHLEERPAFYVVVVVTSPQDVLRMWGSCITHTNTHTSHIFEPSPVADTKNSFTFAKPFFCTIESSVLLDRSTLIHKHVRCAKHDESHHTPLHIKTYYTSQILRIDRPKSFS